MDEVKASDGLVDSIVKDSTKDGKIYTIPTFLSIIYHVRSADGRCRKVHAGTCRPHRNPGKGQKVRLMWYSRRWRKSYCLIFYNVDSKLGKEDGSLDETKVSDYLTQVKRIYDVDDHSDIESYGNFFESGMCDGYRYGTIRQHGFICREM